MRMFWRRLKYVHGRGPLKRNKLVLGLYAVLVLVIVFAPWQTVVLREYNNWRVHVESALGMVSSDSISVPVLTVPGTGKSGTVPAPLLKVTDPLHAYGIAAGGAMAGMSVADINKELDDIVSLGATWVRFDVEWQNIQYQDANHYDWGDYDKVVNATAAHHLKMVGILAYTPKWARASGCNSPQCPPADPAQFAKFAAAAATHYAPKGLQAWEIWNEPNTAQFWQPNANPAAYTKVLQAAYTAVKLANPQAIIITGGLSPQDTTAANMSELDFLQGVYANGGKGFFDAVGDHPYTYPLLPSDSSGNAWSRMSQTGVSLRSIMEANGDSVKKIWLTEFGAPTGGPGDTATEENYATVHDTWHVDEQLQADMATRAVQLYKNYDWVGPLMWYSYKDTSTDQSTNENFFGLLRHDGSQKAAYVAFKKAITQ